MGALCGKESKSDNFAGAGRPVGSTPEQRATAPLPSNKRVVGGPPRTLGGGGAATGYGTVGAATTSATSPDPGGAASPDEQRRIRAEAAEARLKSKSTGGKLEAASRAQRGLTDNQINKQQYEELRKQRQNDLDQDVQRYD